MDTTGFPDPVYMVIKMADGVVETRQRILSAAKREFAERGFDGSRMGSIARRAQVNQALIHYYFGTKDNLYNEVLGWLFGIDFMKDVDIVEELKAMNLSPDQILYTMLYISVYAHLDIADQDMHPILAREVAEGNRFLRPIVKDYLVPRLLVAESIIQSGIEQGIFQTDNPLMVVMQHLNFISSYAIHKMLYRDTEVFSRIYESYSTEKFFNYMITSIIKILTPAGHEVHLPEIPSSLIEYMEKIIQAIRERKASLDEGEQVEPAP